jgi:PAS domain S-box-containing protein
VPPAAIPWERLFAIQSVPFSVIDGHGRVAAFNRAYADFLGYSMSEVSDLDIGQITRSEDEPWTRNYLMRLYSGEIDHFESDKWYVRKDGAEVCARLITDALYDDQGHFEYLVAALVPREDEPRVLEADLAQRLLADTTETVTLVGADGIVRFSKGEMVRVAGYPTSYWKGRHISELLPPGDFQRRMIERADFLATPGAVIETELEVRAGDGSPHHVALRGINRTDDPVLAGFVLVSRDITAARAELADLARRHRTAEAVADAQTRLLATVSHELRNPLHAVRGLAELLLQEDLSPAASDLAASLVRQISGLAHVTQDLLDAARLDAGKVALNPVPTNIQTLLDDVVGLGRAAAGDKHLTITNRVGRGVPEWIIVDTGRLRQILSNLMGNAVKFTDAGSIEVIARNDGAGSIVLSIIDTGRGIPPEEHDAVLEPFAVGSTAGASGGAGLGLSIVHRLVSAMDGSVALTSSVGEGSRLDVTLPLVVAPPPAPEPDAGNVQGMRVLVIEDDPINQHLARSQLGRLGVDAIVVDSGEEGLEVLRGGEPIDAVLMDHHLPGWDGIETTRRIRELGGPVATTPVIGLSASASPAHHRQFINAGMNDFVAKPASIDDLAAALSRIERAPTAAVADQSPAGATADPIDEPTGDPIGDPIVDQRTLIELEDELGSQEVVRRLVDTFLLSLESRVADIEAGAAIARRTAHTLKSGARLLGADRLAHLCAVAEDTGEAPDAIRTVAADTRRWFEEWRRSAASRPEPVATPVATPDVGAGP